MNFNSICDLSMQVNLFILYIYPSRIMLRLYTRGIFFIHEYLVWFISIETECKISCQMHFTFLQVFGKVKVIIRIKFISVTHYKLITRVKNGSKSTLDIYKSKLGCHCIKIWASFDENNKNKLLILRYVT